jgi:hypothetical protein
MPLLLLTAEQHLSSVELVRVGPRLIAFACAEVRSRSGVAWISRQ